MSLIQKVYGALRWKKNDDYTADKLGIPLAHYQEIKNQILQVKELLEQELDNSMVDLVSRRMSDSLDEQTIKDQYISELEDILTQVLEKNRTKVIEVEENLEEGTGKIKVLCATEPKSPEDVEEFVKIKDSPKWQLSHYYNKQQPNGLWLVTALVSRKTLNTTHLLEETLKNFKPKYTPVFDPVLNEKFDKKSCAVLSLQDLHFGKEGNDDVVSDFKAAVTNLVRRAHLSHHVDEIVYVVGGDLLNMDAFNGTTTKGTPVDNSMRAQEAYSLAFDALFWSVNFLKQYCNRLIVVYLPGNHDRLSSFHMAHALSKCFATVPDIHFDVEYAERKVHIYGQNMFCFEHGDVKTKNPGLLYATEFPVQWGSSTYRTCYTGHYHSKKTVEYVTEDEVHGFTFKILPSLSRSDYYHYHNKYTGAKRQAVMDLHDYHDGKVAELVYVA